MSLVFLWCHAVVTTTVTPVVGKEPPLFVDYSWVSIMKRFEIPQNIWGVFVWELCNYSFSIQIIFFLLPVPVSPTLHHHLPVNNTFSVPCLVT